MEVPEKTMRSCRARAEAYRNEAWARLEEHREDIERISRDGPSDGDQVLLMQALCVVKIELAWRLAHKQSMEQGVFLE